VRQEEIIEVWRKLHNKGILNCSIRVKIKEDELDEVYSVERRDYTYIHFCFILSGRVGDVGLNRNITLNG
jgi:urate oxidase